MVLLIALLAVQVSTILEVHGTETTSSPHVAKPSRGNGTAEDPYLITTLEQLQGMNGFPSAYYRLTNDINASSTNIGKGFDPIGDNGKPFTGSFDGGGYTINSLCIDRPENYVGLFGYVTGARITNLSLNDVRMSGVGYFGSLIGYAKNSIIEDCIVQGTIVGTFSYYVGGLIGWSEGSETMISRCSVSVTLDLSRTYGCGGIVGWDNGGHMDNCSFGGNIRGGDGNFYSYYIGGLEGYSSTGSIEMCSATGTLDFKGYGLNYIGGGIGSIGSGRIENAISSVDLSIQGIEVNYIGGLIGSLYTTRVEECSVDLSMGIKGSYGYGIGGLIGYSSGQIKGSHLIGDKENRVEIGLEDFVSLNRVGGLIGENNGPISDCRSESDITIERTSASGGPNQYYYLGGLIGLNNWVATNCSWFGSFYFDSLDALSVKYLGGLVGYNTNLISKCGAQGLLTVTDRVDSIGGLVGYNGGTIIDSRSWVDFFRSIVSDAYNIGGLSGDNAGDVVGSLALEGVRMAKVENRLENIGGLIGRNGATIEDCQARGDIGYDEGTPTVINIGVMIGLSMGPVDDCVASGNITVDASKVVSVGGLIGFQKGTTSNCRSTGDIDISSDDTVDNIGGLAGTNEIGKVEGCSSEGVILVNGNCDVSNVGGLLGLNKGPMSWCRSSSSIRITLVPQVNGVIGIGGLIGDNYNPIDNCEAECRIRIDMNGDPTNNMVSGIGGLVGTNRGNVRLCSSKVDISPLDVDIKYYVNRAGGLIGSNIGGRVEYSYSEGSLSLNNSVLTDVGGMLGHSTGDLMNSYSLVKFFLYGGQTPLDENTFGGFIGTNDGIVSYCYCVPSQKGAGGLVSMGGFAGSNLKEIVSCFYEDDEFKIGLIEEGSEAKTKLFGKSSTLMKKESNYTLERWDFEVTWGIVEDRTYPFLRGIYIDPIIHLDTEIYCLEDTSLAIPYTIVISDYPSINVVSKFIFDTDADWLKSDSKRFFGTPDNDDVGTKWISLEVWDLVGEKANVTFNFEVLNVNDPPEIVTENLESISEDEDYSRYYYAVDMDPILTRLRWEFASDAKWLKFEGNHLHGTPRYYDIGEYWVNLSVWDNENEMDFSNFTINVESANDPPNITTVPLSICYEDEFYRLPLSVEDPDEGDSITWTLKSDFSWLKINRTHVYGRPGNDDVGMSWVLLRVRDNENTTDDLRFILEVRNVNDAPKWLIVPANLNITEGKAMVATAMAFDEDIGDTLTYGIAAPPEMNITINNVTGTIYWDQPVLGNYTVELTATDSESTISTWFNVTVRGVQKPDLNVTNHPPRIEQIGNITVKVNDTLVIELDATDADGDNLTFGIMDPPANMVISSDGVLVWTPRITDIGIHKVTVNVTDGGSFDTMEFNITVDAPSGGQGGGGGDDGEKGESMAFLITTIALGIVCLMLILLLIVVVLRGRSVAHAEPKEGPSME